MISRLQSWYERNWRWFLLATLFYSTFLCYLDRQALSVAIQPLKEEFGLNNIQVGRLLAIFIYVYASCHLVVAFVLDRIRNLRRLFTVMVVGWSLVTIATGLVRNYHEMMFLRALLGVFECANFPLCWLVISRVFPREQKAFASGVVASGAVLATLVAPKLVIHFTLTQGWRPSFMVFGILSLTWVIPWLLVFRRPEERSSQWRKAVAAAEENRPGVLHATREVFSCRSFWIMTCAGICVIPGVYFVSQWLPTYFSQTWGVSFDQALGDRLVLVYLMQDLGLWLSGAAVALLCRAGWSVVAARRSIVIIAYACAIPIVLLPFMKTVDQAFPIICLLVFALGAWSPILNAFKQEILPARVGTVTAFIAFCETLFSAFVVQKVGEFTQSSGGFAGVFCMLGGFLTVAIVICLFGFRERWFNRQILREEISTPDSQPSLTVVATDKCPVAVTPMAVDLQTNTYTVIPPITTRKGRL